MKVIDPYMEEHRVIEKVVGLFDTEILNLKDRNYIDPIRMYIAIDFVCTYVDLTHHIKEEDILFRELLKKKLSPDHEKMLNELIAEHKMARTIIGKWTRDNWRYLHGEDTSGEIIGYLKELKRLFGAHIQKEDGLFFPPVLDYFSEEEQKRMLEKFAEFDKQVLHWRYRKAEKMLRGNLWDEKSVTGC